MIEKIVHNIEEYRQVCLEMGVEPNEEQLYFPIYIAYNLETKKYVIHWLWKHLDKENLEIIKEWKNSPDMNLSANPTTQ